MSALLETRYHLAPLVLTIFTLLKPGKAIGSQPVERMETASLRGRRRRKIPDEDEGTSLDDMLKTVDSKPNEKEDKNEDGESAKVDEKEAGSRRESVTKLPTGRQVRQQEVRGVFTCDDGLN